MTGEQFSSSGHGDDELSETKLVENLIRSLIRAVIYHHCIL